MNDSTPIQLISSGDLRLVTNLTCWPVQYDMETKLTAAIAAEGFTIERAHPVTNEGHGFIKSQKHGMEVFKKIDPNAPLIVAEAVWQFSHHVLAGLTTHRGPIPTVAHWSGPVPYTQLTLPTNNSV